MKKLIKEWREYLEEGTSDVAYHITDVGNLFSVIEQNRFMTSVAKGAAPDEKGNRGKDYFLSMARSKLSKYFQSASHMKAILVLDGQKISQRYKVAPVDYWGPNYTNQDEMEDRVVTNKPYIEKAMDYINEVHILISDHRVYGIYMTSVMAINDMEKTLEARNIPVFYYIDEKNFLLLNKKRSFSSVAETVHQIEKSTGKKVIDNSKEEPIERSNYQSLDTRELISLIELVRAIEMEDYKKIFGAKYGSDISGFISQLRYEKEFAKHLANIIQNNRRKTGSREFLDDLFSYMRSKKMKSMEDLSFYLSKEIDRIYKEKRSRESGNQ